MGDKVRIKVVAANLDKRQLDYEWVGGGGQAEEDVEEKGKGRSKPGKKKKRTKDQN